MRVNLSVAIVYMVKDPGMSWHESQQGIILGMFFYGYVLTQLPGGRLAEIIGKARCVVWTIYGVRGDCFMLYAAKYFPEK